MNSAQQRADMQVSQQPTSPSLGPTTQAGEPVFRFYLSPPQPQPMYQPLPGVYPGYGGYLPMSPAPGSYQQYYGPAMPMPATAAPSMYYGQRPSMAGPAPTTSPAPQAMYSKAEMNDATMVAGELDGGRAEAPTGGYGMDENGQYIEIKFPSMGRAEGSRAVGSAPAAEKPASLPTPVAEAKPQISVFDEAQYVEQHMEDIVLDRQAYFWNIANWDALDKRATSDVFRCGGHAWRILLRPFGSSHKGVLSFFLESMDAQPGNPDVRITCKFVLAVANPNDPTHSTSGSAYHCFTQNNPNWGFTRFMKLAELRTGLTPGAKPFIENGACTICAYVQVLRDPSQ